MPPYLYISSWGTDDALVIVDALAGAPPVSGLPDLVGVLRDALINNPCGASVYGGYAYIPCSAVDRLVIADISDPTTPVVVSSIEGAGAPNYLGGAVYCHVRSNGLCYVVSVTDDSLSIFDVSNPLAPVLAGVPIRGAGAPPGGNYLDLANSVFVDANLIAYVTAQGDNSLTLIDVSTPAVPVLLGNIAGAGAPNFLSSVRRVVVSGIYAYTVSFTDQRLCIFNISVPATPTLEGSITHAMLGEAISLRVLGNYAYVVSMAAGDGLSIFNIANPAAPAYVGNLIDWGHIGGCRDLVVLEDTDRAYVLGSNAAVDAVSRVNVANPAAPAWVSWLQGSGAPNYLDTPQYITQIQAFQTTVPTVTTDSATPVEQTSATPNGTLDDDGGEACDCSFEYGETTAYGSTTATQSKETDETFSQEVRGLRPGGITYHFRAVATNSEGTSYGADQTFRTEALSAEAHQALGKHHSLGRHGL